MYLMEDEWKIIKNKNNNTVTLAGQIEGDVSVYGKEAATIIKQIGKILI